MAEGPAHDIDQDELMGKFGHLFLREENICRRENIDEYIGVVQRGPQYSSYVPVPSNSPPLQVIRENIRRDYYSARERDGSISSTSPPLPEFERTGPSTAYPHFSANRENLREYEWPAAASASYQSREYLRDYGRPVSMASAVPSTSYQIRENLPEYERPYSEIASTSYQIRENLPEYERPYSEIPSTSYQTRENLQKYMSTQPRARSEASSSSISHPPALPPSASQHSIPLVVNKYADRSDSDVKLYRTSTETINSTDQQSQLNKGTTGEEIKLITNYYKLCSVDDLQIYLYNVEFSKDDILPGYKRICVKKYKDVFGIFHFDGVNLFLMKPFTKAERTFTFQNAQESFYMTIKFIKLLEPVDPISMSDPINEFLSKILNKCLSKLPLKLIGRNYYQLDKPVINRANGSFFQGYIMRLEHREQDILLNVELTHKFMRDETAYDVMHELYSNNFSSEMMENYMKGKFVITPYNNRCYQIYKIDYAATPKRMFNDENGDGITYLQYYQEKYNKRIKYVDQPLLVAKFRLKGDQRGKIFIHLVPELCNMLGINLDLTDMHAVRYLANATSFDPLTHFKKIDEHVGNIIKTPNSLALLNDWDLDLKKQCIDITARVLPNENIIFANGKRILFQDIGPPIPLINSKHLKYWCILTSEASAAKVKEFVSTMKKDGNKLGVPISDPSIIYMQDDSSKSFKEHLDKNLAKDKLPQLVVCILLNFSRERYRDIKKKCSVEYGVPSQVIISKSIDECKIRGCVSKRIIQQITCKIYGTPWTVDIPFKNYGVIFIGISTFALHNIRPQKYYGFFASLNCEFSKFSCYSEKYTTQDDLMKKITQQIYKSIRDYQRANDDKLPGNIFIYRDTVLKRDVDFVQTYEVGSILAMIKEKFNHCNIKIVYILINNFPNTRFVTKNLHNPPIGTVVDTEIIRPNKYEFYLISQASIPPNKHLVSPTLYTVLCNKSSLNADQIQRLTYKLTHLYFNNITTIKIPAPIRYAQRIAQFSAVSLHASPHQNLRHTLHFL